MPGPDTDIRSIRGVGEKRACLFEKLGIRNLRELIGWFPRDYEDRSRIKAIADTVDGETVCVRAMIAGEVRLSRVRRGLDIAKVRAVDGQSVLELTFFNQSFVKTALHRGETYTFYGQIRRSLTRVEMTNPAFLRGQESWGIVPIYRLTAGLTAGMMQAAVRQGLQMLSEQMEDILPAEIRRRNGLCHSRFAYENIHAPSCWEALEQARRRLIFEELFVFSCGLQLLRERRTEQSCPPLQADTAPFLAALPFRFTAAQSRAAEEIGADLAAGRPMNRLVQGDVGSGKTAVAALAAYIAGKNGLQTAVMAPTEILARQHYAFFAPLMERLGLRTLLLVGGMTAAQKRRAQAQIAQGLADVVIGTHALISGGVAFQNLGLVITDEQHRFGVEQRAALTAKGSRPHVLVMSATPIPRTLALILYGDLDISVIDELPPGRQKVDTYVVGEDKRPRLYRFLRRQVELGGQVFVVCPAVEDSEAVDVKAAETYARQLQTREFPDLRVAVLHGRMKSDERERVMGGFAAGAYDILVATTVIEVGVDVPNATLMVVENAERFGLSQLHQLRGRVGRGEKKSWCILVTQAEDGPARERLRVLCRTGDGFAISEEDLRLRGPGDFFGRRQHGLPALKIASLSGDTRVLKQAQQEAQAFIAAGGMDRPEAGPLRREMERLFHREEGALN